MSIYDPPETYQGPLPSQFQPGTKVKYKEEDATIVAVEFHEDGRVEYLVRSGDPEYGGAWCNSNGFQPIT